ncbi:MAG: hypothetical protein AAFR36_28125 [Bacteroidota bacterium]
MRSVYVLSLILLVLLQFSCVPPQALPLEPEAVDLPLLAPVPVLELPLDGTQMRYMDEDSIFLQWRDFVELREQPYRYAIQIDKVATYRKEGREFERVTPVVLDTIVAANQLKLSPAQLQASDSISYYQWSVQLLDQDAEYCVRGCQSRKRTFSLTRNSTGCVVETFLEKLTCAEKAYVLVDGVLYVEYSMSITVSNTSPNQATLNWWDYMTTGSNFADQMGLITDAGPVIVVNTPTLPSTLASGQNFPFSLIVQVPLGATTFTAVPNFHHPEENPISPPRPLCIVGDPVTVNLPPCLCDPCERFAPEFLPAATEFLLPNFGANNLLRVTQNFRVAPSYQGVKVQAEVIYFERFYRNSACYECLQAADTHGDLVAPNTQMNIGAWQNQGQPAGFIGGLNSAASRAVYWLSQSSNGIDLSTTQQLQLDIAIPPRHPFHANCRDIFRIHIRYSFTDVSCQVCEEVITYTVHRP